MTLDVRQLMDRWDAMATLSRSSISWGLGDARAGQMAQLVLYVSLLGGGSADLFSVLALGLRTWHVKAEGTCQIS